MIISMMLESFADLKAKATALHSVLAYHKGTQSGTAASDARRLAFELKEALIAIEGRAQADPPVDEYEHGKLYVYDATSQTFDLARNAIDDEQLKLARRLSTDVLKGIKDMPVNYSQVHAKSHWIGLIDDMGKLVNVLIDAEEKRLDVSQGKSTTAWCVLNKDGTPDPRNIWPRRPSRWVRLFHENNGFTICRIEIICRHELEATNGD